MTNDKLEYMERRFQTLEETVDNVEREIRTELRRVEVTNRAEVNAVEKQVTAIQITLAKWLGMGIVIFSLLQILSAALITHYIRDNNERIPTKIVQK